MIDTYTILWLALSLVILFKMLQCARMIVMPRTEQAEKQFSKLKRRHPSRVFNILLSGHCFVRLYYSLRFQNAGPQNSLIISLTEFSIVFSVCPGLSVFPFSGLTRAVSFCIHSDFNHNLDYKRFQIYIGAAWRAFYSFSLPSLVSSSSNMISIIANIYHVSSTKLMLGTLQGKYDYIFVSQRRS